MEAGKRGGTHRAISLLKRALDLNPVHYPVCEILFKLTREASYRDCVRKYAPSH